MIQIEWKGETYVIPENEVFEVGEQIEDIVTLADLHGMATNPRFRKLARCYAVMLRHAGASVTDQDVHTHMMDGLKGEDDKAILALNAVTTLTNILMDGAPEMDEDDEGDKKKTKSSSRRSSKSR